MFKKELKRTIFTPKRRTETLKVSSKDFERKVLKVMESACFRTDRRRVRTRPRRKVR